MQGHYTDIWQAIAQREPDRTAIVTPSRRLSYREFAAEAGALSRSLHDAGLRPGDAVMIDMYNRAEYLVGLYACFASGFAPVLINWRYRAKEVAALVDDSEPAAIMFPASLASVVTEALAITGRSATTLVSVDDPGDEQADPISGALQYRDLVATPGDLPAKPPPGGELRLYTGGTTGRPRAVVWPADVILDVQDYSIYGSLGLASPTTLDEAVAAALDPATPHVVTLPLAPFMHGTAFFNAMNALAIGGTVAIQDARGLDADDAVRFALEQSATRLIVAGDVVALPFVEAADRAGIGRIDSLTSIISSGMRFSDEVKRRLHALGSLEIIDMLAATEGGPFAINVTRSVDDLPGQLQLMPGAVVFDSDMREVQETPGATGIIAYRGSLPTGYHGDPDKTRATFPVIGGVRYVMPGDWAEVLEGGHIELLGRGSSVVNTGGEKVYPAEVEEAILDHASVRDAVVFGAPDPRFGERVVAVVALEEGAAITHAELSAHLDERLAGYKKPRTVAVAESLQRSPHGKVDMKRMRELVESADGATATTREAAAATAAAAPASPAQPAASTGTKEHS